MKTWKLVAGILSIILFGVIIFQSCVAGIVDNISDSEEASGAIGAFCGLLILAGGIVSIAVRKSYKPGPNIALIVLFSLAALFGYTGHGSYKDLIVWSTWAVVNALLALICIFRRPKKAAVVTAAPEEPSEDDSENE